MQELFSLIPKSSSLLFYLIPQPLLPGEKWRNAQFISYIAPHSWVRGWGEACRIEGLRLEFFLLE
jgi:hypothetical protein